GYQITQIINRSSVNINVDAKIQGLEIEGLWTPAENWLLTANIGLLDAQVKNTYGIDLLDRTNGRSDLVVLKNASTYSNCVVSAQGYATLLGAIQLNPSLAGGTRGLCNGQFAAGIYDAVNGTTGGSGDATIDRAVAEGFLGLTGSTITYTDANGKVQTASLLQPIEGDAKSLDGNTLPGAPDATVNLAAEYTFPSLGGSNWDFTIRGDYYWQAESVTRVWNTPRDSLDAWSNVNLSLLFNNDESGWGVEIFAKNLTDEEVITGAYLTDDSSGLYTNVFLTEPALYGVTIKKSW
ncbi:MAG TPA: TonB-dependent receptor, partial [Hyphomonas sp.]|nr:TonB-dependent receptor [Hyphomonas sp.]